MHMPYALQLAYGAVRLSLVIAVSMCVLLVPLIILLTTRWGAVGGAAAWLVLNIFYLFFGTWLTHRELLPALGANWLAKDVGVPALMSVIVIVIARKVDMFCAFTLWPTLILAGFFTLFTVFANIMLFADTRAWIKHSWVQMKAMAA
jgi:hypothetical protein